MLDAWQKGIRSTVDDLKMKIFEAQALCNHPDKFCVKEVAKGNWETHRCIICDHEWKKYV